PDGRAGDGRDAGDAVEEVVRRRTRTGNDRPGSAIPALDQREERAVLQVVADRRTRASREARYRSESVARTWIGARDDRPLGSVPGFDERLTPVPNSRAEVGRHAGNPLEDVLSARRTRAGHDRPHRAVPALDHAR